MNKKIKTLLILVAVCFPAISFATQGDLQYGSSTKGFNAILPIGATNTVMLSTGSIPQWVATSSLGLNIAPFFTATSTTATSTFPIASSTCFWNGSNCLTYFINTGNWA